MAERLLSGTGRCSWGTPRCRGRAVRTALAVLRHASDATVVRRPVASPSASAGAVTAVALLAFAGTRSVRRLRALVGLLWQRTSWMWRGCCTPRPRSPTRREPAPSALHAEGGVPAPLAALGLGGIWNSEVVRSFGRTGARRMGVANAPRRARRCRTRPLVRRHGRRDVIAVRGLPGSLAGGRRRGPPASRGASAMTVTSARRAASRRGRPSRPRAG